MRTATPPENWEKFHKWEMSVEEQKGIVVYLRSLTPEPQGELDFGRIFRGKGDKDRDDKDRDKGDKGDKGAN